MSATTLQGLSDQKYGLPFFQRKRQNVAHIQTVDKATLVHVHQSLIEQGAVTNRRPLTFP